jgi:hypothetical protein
VREKLTIVIIMQGLGFPHVPYTHVMLPYGPEVPGYWPPQVGAFQSQILPWQTGPGMGNPDEISSIFISGFPEDAKPREVLNLVRHLDGYVVGTAGLLRCSASTADSHKAQIMKILA